MPRVVDPRKLAERFHQIALILSDPRDREIVQQYADELRERSRRRAQSEKSSGSH
jgi:hypothetical protein